MRRARRSRLALLGVITLALGATGGSEAADAKKKRKRGGTVDITKTVGLPIPDETGGAPGIDGILISTIDVAGRRFRRTRVRDVDVGLQIAGTGTNSVADLKAQLTAPNGATTVLFFPMNLFPGNLAGPVTFDDQTPINLGTGPPSGDPNFLFAPYQGTAQPFGNIPLAGMDGGPPTGTWTLTIRDDINGNTNTLGSWRLNVIAGRPFKTK